MLVTTEGVLKLTDFGEVRTAEVDMTMTAVGTPIFMCPEIIRSGRYDAKADSYSFGICLVAMMRVEDTIVNFFFNALIKKMRKATRMGVGLMALNRNIEKGAWLSEARERGGLRGPSTRAAEHTCGRAHVRPSTRAAEHTCGRAHVRPSTCAAEHTCGRAHVRPRRQ
jgi:hypothetical protein